MIKHILAFITAISLLLSVGASPVSAISEIQVPNFPSCTSPSGTPKVSYSTGIHGIVGLGEFSGADAVYIVSDSNIMQCFCAADGNGIQTDWWKIGSLTFKQISSLKKLGWIYIPSGSAWGLESVAYMAKNTNYFCGSNAVVSTGGNGGTGGAGSAPVCDSIKPASPHLISTVRKGDSVTLTWSKAENATHYTIYYGADPKSWDYSVPNTGDVTTFTITSLDPNVQYSYSVIGVNNCMPGDPGGQVLGASSGQVLGLAATGNIVSILALLGLSALSLSLSVFYKKTVRGK